MGRESQNRPFSFTKLIWQMISSVKLLNILLSVSLSLDVVVTLGN